MIEKYLGPLIFERLGKPFPEGDATDSIAMIGLEDANPVPLEELLERTCDTPNFDSIFEKLKLGNDPDPDETIYAALAVVQAIDFLKKRDYKNIKVVPTRRKTKTVDLIARYRSEDWAIEVKHITGSDIKRLRRIGNGLGYKVDEAGIKAIVDTLRLRIDDALEQIEEFVDWTARPNYKRAVIIASRQAQFWLFPKLPSLVLSELFESCYRGSLDKIVLLVGLYEPEIAEYPLR